MDFINHLLSFSSSIISLELDKTSINRIIWLDETYYREDYLDPLCYSFQINLINAKEIMLARIINNFDEAIKSKCGNDIDLSEYSDKDYWKYGNDTDEKQQNINKRYYNIRLTPRDEKVFKKLWLRTYIKDLSQILSNIRTVTNNPKQVAIDKSKNDTSEVKKDAAEAITGNPYPLLFVSPKIYKRFLEYTSKYILDVYLDYSYLKKRMEYEKLIHRTKDNEFMRIAYEDMGLIAEAIYQDYLIKNKLSSLDKSSTAARENNFNNLFNI